MYDDPSLWTQDMLDLGKTYFASNPTPEDIAAKQQELGWGNDTLAQYFAKATGSADSYAPALQAIQAYYEKPPVTFDSLIPATEVKPPAPPPNIPVATDTINLSAPTPVDTYEPATTTETYQPALVNAVPVEDVFYGFTPSATATATPNPPKSQSELSAEAEVLKNLTANFADSAFSRGTTVADSEALAALEKAEDHNSVFARAAPFVLAMFGGPLMGELGSVFGGATDLATTSVATTSGLTGGNAIDTAINTITRSLSDPGKWVWDVVGNTGKQVVARGLLTGEWSLDDLDKMLASGAINTATGVLNQGITSGVRSALGDMLPKDLIKPAGTALTKLATTGDPTQALLAGGGNYAGTEVKNAVTGALGDGTISNLLGNVAATGANVFVRTGGNMTQALTTAGNRGVVEAWDAASDMTGLTQARRDLEDYAKTVGKDFWGALREAVSGGLSQDKADKIAALAAPTNVVTLNDRFNSLGEPDPYGIFDSQGKLLPLDQTGTQVAGGTFELAAIRPTTIPANVLDTITRTALIAGEGTGYYPERSGVDTDGRKYDVYKVINQTENTDVPYAYEIKMYADGTYDKSAKTFYGGTDRITVTATNPNTSASTPNNAALSSTGNMDDILADIDPSLGALDVDTSVATNTTGGLTDTTLTEATDSSSNTADLTTDTTDTVQTAIDALVDANSGGEVSDDQLVTLLTNLGSSVVSGATTGGGTTTTGGGTTTTGGGTTTTGGGTTGGGTTTTGGGTTGGGTTTISGGTTTISGGTTATGGEGTPGIDTIGGITLVTDSSGGNSTITGGDGNSTITGGDGNSTITGGTGNDVVTPPVTEPTPPPPTPPPTPPVTEPTPPVTEPTPPPTPPPPTPPPPTPPPPTPPPPTPVVKPPVKKEEGTNPPVYAEKEKAKKAADQEDDDVELTPEEKRIKARIIAERPDFGQMLTGKGVTNRRVRQLIPAFKSMLKQKA